MVWTVTPWSVSLWRGSSPQGLSFDSDIDCTSFDEMLSEETRPVSRRQEDGDDIVLLEGSPQLGSSQPKPTMVDTAFTAPVVLSDPPLESIAEIQQDADEEGLVSDVGDDSPRNTEDGGKRPRLASNDENILMDLQQLVSDLFTASGHEDRLTENQLAHPLEVLMSQ